MKWLQPEIYTVQWMEQTYGKQITGCRLFGSPRSAAEFLLVLETRTRAENPKSYVSESLFVTYKIAGTPL